VSRAWFPDFDAVDDFLRVHQFDTDSPLDMHHLQRVHREAVLYLTELHGYQLPESAVHPEIIHDLFLTASAPASSEQRYACMLLKVMHVMHHINARELVARLPVSEEEFMARLNTKVFGCIDHMRGAGIGISGFTTGQKSRESLVTKLLAKRETLAAHIFDKLRFRIVLKTRADIVLALLYLVRNLVPFNYVIPGESKNGLITRDDLVRGLDLAPETIRDHWGDDFLANSGAESPPTPPNEFSGASFRCVNFVADIPLRLDDAGGEEQPAIAVMQAEIQLVDAETDDANNAGENAHPLYKGRQLNSVRRRLEGP
jgi:uncharacterized protein (TIGR04552 family)